ncbi:MAG TPA: hypothetical protein VJU61_07790 [Polyangiaceae bacterium]|nr:hypothetical protein [Polyangiaceae bacterium]
MLIRNSSRTGIALCWLALAAVGCGAQSDSADDTTAGERQAELRGDEGADDAASDDGADTGSADATDPAAPVACTLISEVADGVCGRPDSDPCRAQDPDCSAGASSEGYDCDVSQVLCRKAVQCADGEVPTVLGSCYGPCVPADQCKPVDEPVACLLFIEESDGVCSRAADDPCKSQDPDCSDEPVVCALFIEESDGVCSRPADDPCKSQDPDCSSDEPVACLLFIEESDGVCSRAADDPCKSQDPDCSAAAGPTACAAYIEAPDGVCSRAPDDPCKGQDPECV